MLNCMNLTTQTICLVDLKILFLFASSIVFIVLLFYSFYLSVSAVSMSMPVRVCVAKIKRFP